MTVKSDDTVGRVKTYEAIVKGQNIPQAGIPESFRVLIKELQSLGLDVSVLDKEKNEIDLKIADDDEDLSIPRVSDDLAFNGSDVAVEKEFENSYLQEDVPEDAGTEVDVDIFGDDDIDVDDEVLD